MNSVKSENYNHRIGDMGHIESDNPNPVYMVVHIVHSRIGVIRVKRGRGEIWIHIMIEKLLLKSISQTQTKKKKQTNKQTNKKKKIK